MKFATVGQTIMIDGGESYDPDMIGITTYAWRTISGPGESYMWFVNEEGNAAEAQCSGVDPVEITLDVGQGEQPLVHHVKPEQRNVCEQVNAEVAIRQLRQVLVVTQ